MPSNVLYSNKSFVKKLLILCAAFFMSLGKFGAQMTEDEYTQKLLKFHESYNLYFRKYFGCPTEAIRPEDCFPQRGVRDWDLEKKVVKAAKLWKDE